MRFAVYRPPQAENTRVPVLYYLSGLTCSEENFMVKAGAQRLAAQLGLMLVVPDTSPRGLQLPGDSDSRYLGEGAGYYVNATQPPWDGHYRMYDYVAEELPALIQAHFPVDERRQSIFGHSMGGLGALVVYLRNPDRYRSISVLEPVCAPTRTQAGQYAYASYLGEDRDTWTDYDPIALVEKHGCPLPILMDQGLADPYYPEHLRPADFVAACRRAGVDLSYREHADYDHSYFFVASFVDEHLRWHAEALAKSEG